MSANKGNCGQSETKRIRMRRQRRGRWDIQGDSLKRRPWLFAMRHSTRLPVISSALRGDLAGGSKASRASGAPILLLGRMSDPSTSAFFRKPVCAGHSVSNQMHGATLESGKKEKGRRLLTGPDHSEL